MKNIDLHTAILILIACLLLCPDMAQAQDEPAPAPKAPFFVPTSGWLVGPATPESLGAPGMPCLMASLFSNGYSFRISADSSRIFAIAIDFRQEAFVPNESYKLTLTISGLFEQDFEATAYNKATLLLNARDYPTLYNALKDADFLSLDISGRQMAFALPGVAEGLERVAACSGGGDATPAKAESPKEYAPPRTGKKAFIPSVIPEQAMRPQIAQKSDQSSVTDIMVNYEPAAGTTEPEMQEGEVRRWRAMRGANLREILDVWTDSEDARLVWNAGRDFPINESLTVQGTLEDAVMALLQQYGNDPIRPVGKIYNNENELAGRVLLIELDGHPD